jgi:hypothetical protein
VVGHGKSVFRCGLSYPGLKDLIRKLDDRAAPLAKEVFMVLVPENMLEMGASLTEINLSNQVALFEVTQGAVHRGPAHPSILLF